MTRVVALLLTSAVTFAQAGTGGQKPVFRSRTDLVHLDVSVLDENRRPVRGLTAADFTITENGIPQKVELFEAIDVPGAVKPPVAWMREVTPDIATNEAKLSRLWLVVVDDALIPTGPYAIRQSKQNVAEILDRFGPEDLVTIVFTADSRPAQDFTNDRAKLLATLRDYNPGWRSNQIGGQDLFEVGAMKTVRNVMDTMIAAPHKRKAMIWISIGPAVNFALPPQNVKGQQGSQIVAAARKVEVAKEVFEAARLANIPIFPLDPAHILGMASDTMITFANQTGGHAYVNVDAGEGPAMDRIFEENSSYYLVGYYTTNTTADGTFRKIDVSVNREDVEVRARSGYLAPKAGEKPPATINEALRHAAASPVQIQDLPLRATAIPIKIHGKTGAAVAVAISLPPPPGATETSGRVHATTELRVTAFTTEGDTKATAQETSIVTLRGGSRAAAGYDALVRLDLPPGRVRLRVAAHQAESNKLGTVMVDVIVPDFAKDAVSMSGVALGLVPERPVSGGDALKGLLPMLPTAQREFRQYDAVTAVFYAYQRTSPFQPAQLTMRITDIKNEVVVTEKQTIAADRFSVKESPGAAEVRYLVPLERLAAGPYLLTIETTITESTFRRDVQFTVR